MMVVKPIWRSKSDIFTISSNLLMMNLMIMIMLMMMTNTILTGTDLIPGLACFLGCLFYELEMGIGLGVFIQVLGIEVFLIVYIHMHIHVFWYWVLATLYGWFVLGIGAVLILGPWGGLGDRSIAIGVLVSFVLILAAFSFVMINNNQKLILTFSLPPSFWDPLNFHNVIIFTRCWWCYITLQGQAWMLKCAGEVM